MRVYLAGPIFGTSDEEAWAWRKELRDEFPSVEFVDPMARDYRGREDESPQEIVDSDLADIASCDIVLANCWKVSAGTAMELRAAFAEMHKKTIVIARPPVSPWLLVHASEWVTHMTGAIRALRRFATPKDPDNAR